MKPLKFTANITQRSSVLDRYLTEISAIGLLSAEQEIELCARIKKGDRKAQDKLVSANLLFLVSVAKKYQCPGFTLDDLIGEGNIGLIRAAGRFDSTRGFKFISFAVWWIRQSILHAIAEKQLIIRLPSNLVNTISKLNKAEAALEQLIQRKPCLEEVAEHSDLNLAELQSCRQSALKTYSLDYTGHGEEGVSLLETLEDRTTTTPDENLIKVSTGIAAVELLERLESREREIMKMSFGIGLPFPMNFDEIGKKLNLSGERIKQLRRASINRLKQYHISEIFDQ